MRIKLDTAKEKEEAENREKELREKIEEGLMRTKLR